MALIQCPECGKPVSDRASNCPECGCPISVRPMNGARMQQNAGNGVSLTALKCPNCQSPLERISKDMARCPNCHNEIVLSGTDMSDDEMVESIFPFKSTKDDFHRGCMKKLMLVAEEDIFSQIANIQVKQYYVWVRQFGAGEKQEFYPMDSFGESMFKKVTGKSPIIPYATFNKMFPKEQFKRFQPRYIGDEELKKKEFSPAEVKQRYISVPESSGYNAYDFYYCVPFFEETFEYKGKTYHFYGTGTDDISWSTNDSLPVCAHLRSKPNYTSAYPLMYTVIAIMSLVAIFFVGAYLFAAFSEGFWAGVFTIILTGVVLCVVGWIAVAILGVVGAAIAGIFGLVDLPIQKSINAKRRSKFRTEYERIQKRKQEEARNSLGLELTYTVPEFPIP